MKIPYLDPQRLLDDTDAFKENDRIRVVLDNDRHVTLMLDPDPRRAPATPVRLIVDRQGTDMVILEDIYEFIQMRQRVGHVFEGRLSFIDRWLNKYPIPSLQGVRESAVMEYVVEHDDAGEPIRPLKTGEPLYLRVGMPHVFTPAIWRPMAVIDSIEYYTM